MFAGPIGRAIRRSRTPDWSAPESSARAEAQTLSARQSKQRRACRFIAGGRREVSYLRLSPQLGIEENESVMVGGMVSRPLPSSAERKVQEGRESMAHNRTVSHW